jgi:hypothetical protein
MKRSTGRNTASWRRRWPPSANLSIVLTTRSGSIRRWAIGHQRSSNGFKPMLPKTRGRPRMRFLRHSGIFRSDVSFQPVTSARVPPPVGRPRSQGIGRDGRCTPCPSSAMSSDWLILDRVARLHCPSPLHQRSQHKSIAASMETNYHRTVTSVLTGCLTPGGHPGTAPLEANTNEVTRCCAAAVRASGFRMWPRS